MRVADERHVEWIFGGEREEDGEEVADGEEEVAEGKVVDERVWFRLQFLKTCVCDYYERRSED